jgi:N-dimethylarginine dimethylaminohydrolase
MTKLLMCPPTFFQVDYCINPWMRNNQGNVDHMKAVEQWTALYNKLREHGVEIDYITPVEGLPDMVFTANAGLVWEKEKIFRASTFKKEERKKEEKYWCDYFEKNGYRVDKYINSTWEGEGDCLIDFEKEVWLGFGYRSDKVSLDNSLELIDPRWYHLDTAFCPLHNNTIMWYPYAFSDESKKLIKKCFKNHVIVDDEDAAAFACNAIVIDNNVYIPKNKNTNAKLRELGYNVYEFDMSEFMKAGGACKCLCLFLER